MPCWKCSRVASFARLLLVDMPGVEFGSNAEKAAVIIHRISLITSLNNQTVPRFTIITGRAFGVVGQALVGSNEGRQTQLSPRVACPSG
mmetsp:Transcript_696/g.845  ORF Transcript_696/g.845 Transcript_696/m.845 type:complete len:89 (-) Transcript_696:1271-1537(-)